jgi:hypothetical protein
MGRTRCGLVPRTPGWCIWVPLVDQHGDTIDTETYMGPDPQPRCASCEWYSRDAGGSR